jgi:sRNA-binding regulator protein Hfq
MEETKTIKEKFFNKYPLPIYLESSNQMDAIIKDADNFWVKELNNQRQDRD